MKFALVRKTRFGGWLAIQRKDGVADDGFARIYTNKPQTREADPELEKAVAMMLAAPELAELLLEAWRIMPLGSVERADWMSRAGDALKAARVIGEPVTSTVDEQPVA